MYSYAARVAPRDRWAIAAYIRALQLSQGAQVAERARTREESCREPAGLSCPHAAAWSGWASASPSCWRLAAGLSFAPAPVAQGWLVAFVFWSGIPVGQPRASPDPSR